MNNLIGRNEPYTLSRFCGPLLLDFLKPAVQARAEALMLMGALQVVLAPGRVTIEDSAEEVGGLTSFCDDHAETLREWLTTGAWVGWERQGEAFFRAHRTSVDPLSEMCPESFSAPSTGLIALACRIFTYAINEGDGAKSGYAHSCVTRGSGFEDALDPHSGPPDVLVAREITAGTLRNRDDDGFVRIPDEARMATKGGKTYPGRHQAMGIMYG